MPQPLLRWGILGTANIARKNWKAIWNSGNGRVAAVASRDLERSRSFIDQCQAHAAFDPAPRPFGNYDELLASPDVDAVYVPLPTGIRSLWVKRAAEAGKHVVGEKPCATSVKELGEMLEVCQRHSVQFMDGVMFMHSRRLERMRKVIDDGETIGSVRRITSAFTFRAEDHFFDSNIRGRPELEPDGCLGDLGWYCIRFALWTLNWKLPLQVTANVLSESQPRGVAPAVPTEFSAELLFDGGVSSSFYCSFRTENEQWAKISGTLGHLSVPDFVLPHSGSQIAFETGSPVFDTQGCDFEMRPCRRKWIVKEHSHSHPTAQESRLFRNFAAQVQSGTLNALWPEMALKTQRVMQACRESSLAHGRPVLIEQ